MVWDVSEMFAECRDLMGDFYEEYGFVPIVIDTPDGARHIKTVKLNYEERTGKQCLILVPGEPFK